VQHKTRIGWTFVIAAKPVTLAECQRFDAGYGADLKGWARTPDCPALAPSWFQAVEYCNWLSKHEGLPENEWCYEPLIDPKAMPALAASTVGLMGSPFGDGALSAACGMYPGRTDPKYTGGMKLAANYLLRAGYRLPTEEEMEYATRAGAITSRYYGETEELLPKYAWYEKNAMRRSWPVGSLKPNDLGLFDMHGNVWCWCQDRYENYGVGNGREAVEVNEGKLLVTSTDSRVLRGGAFGDLAANVRSANRGDSPPPDQFIGYGFRLARALPFKGVTASPLPAQRVEK
jgi:eukaryotic-like serine/threonine-protein kinase